MGRALGLLVPLVGSAAVGEFDWLGVFQQTVQCPEVKPGASLTSAEEVGLGMLSQLATAGLPLLHPYGCACVRLGFLLPKPGVFSLGREQGVFSQRRAWEQLQARPGNCTQAPLYGRGNRVLTTVLVVLCWCAGRSRNGP